MHARMEQLHASCTAGTARATSWVQLVAGTDALFCWLQLYVVVPVRCSNTRATYGTAESTVLDYGVRNHYATAVEAARSTYRTLPVIKAYAH